MRKYILMALAAIALMLAAPKSGSAMPPVGGGLATAADGISSTEEVRHRRWHRRHYRGYRGYRVHRYRVVRCWHRRHWSGRRCW